MHFRKIVAGVAIAAFALTAAACSGSTPVGTGSPTGGVSPGGSAVAPSTPGR